ncbi:MAG TPA: DUF4249 domain-containing protein [Chitinophagaceae bacterium]|nr:DUF4249 domain-containing protein [Chitinophagaceae bacterium]
MQLTIRVFIAIFIFSLLTGCVKQASLNYRTTNPLLVVEGTLLTDSTPCQVTLSYSGLFNSAGYQAQNFVNDATVFLKDDMGDSTQLVNQGQGAYLQVNNFYAQVGHSYSLSITLANGKRYASFPEKIAPVQKDFELDTFAVTNDYAFDDLYGMQVEIRTKDPADQQNYYRWTSVDWIAREATGIPCGFNPCFVYCFQFYNDPLVHIMSDAAVNGNEMRQQVALVSPLYTIGKHYIQLKQMSLTRQAYEFWKLYGEQTTRTGSILDPLPAPIQGNIYNVNDSTELALGYFEASDVSTIKLIFGPEYINAYYTLRNRKNHIDQGACYVIYPNAINEAPPGWEDAPLYIVPVY